MNLVANVTYKTRLRRSSGLPYGACWVGCVIADLRYSRHLRTDEPLEMSLRELADECCMDRKTLAKYLKRLTESGWLHVTVPARTNGDAPAHYLKSRYLLTEPDARGNSDSEPVDNSRSRGTRMDLALGGHVPPIVGTRVGNVLRSKYLEDVDDDAHSSGGGVNGQDSQNPEQSPLPPTTPGSVVEVAEPPSDEQLWRLIDEQREAERTTELASPALLDEFRKALDARKASGQ